MRISIFSSLLLFLLFSISCQESKTSTTISKDSSADAERDRLSDLDNDMLASLHGPGEGLRAPLMIEVLNYYDLTRNLCLANDSNKAICKIDTFEMFSMSVAGND
ncbi:MAG: hypothetical protein KBD78_16310 [Oligoflexales bacterium]|nr:hypothetical protein [Oligoflexales bacterium]